MYPKSIVPLLGSVFLLITGVFDVAAEVVAGGSSHSIVLREDGTVWTFGDNSYGLMGNGTYERNDIRETPNQVPDLSNIVAVTAGGMFSLALKDDGTVWGWGDASYGNLGNGEGGGYMTTIIEPSPIQMQISEVVAIAGGNNFSLMLIRDGTVWGTGYNAYGALGDDNPTSWGEGRNTPVQATGLSGIISLAPGSMAGHSMALKDDGTLWTWGGNGNGQLGVGSDVSASAVPVQVEGLTGVVSAARGGGHSLAVLRDGSVWAWGANGYGQLGVTNMYVLHPEEENPITGPIGSTNVPLQVVGISNVVAVAAGYGFSVALRDDGTVWTWGENEMGQLGDGTYGQGAMRRLPSQVAGSTNIVSIACGEDSVLAVTADGNIWVWGTIVQSDFSRSYIMIPTPTEILLTGAMTEGTAADEYVFNDFDGDGLSDIVVQNEASGLWYFLLSSQGFSMTSLGRSGFIPVPGDYDGDGRADPAVCDTASGTFYILKSSDNSLSLTTVNSPAGNSPVGGGDYNGDGLTDPALYNPITGAWLTDNDSDYLGTSGSEPFWGDYDGDGKSDLAAYNPASGLWFAELSRTREDLSFGWMSGCEAVPGDYDGDRQADPALYSEAWGTWFILLSDYNYDMVMPQFGGRGFTPVSGDYDGDGKADLTLYHESSGYWYRLLSASDYALDTVWFGAPGYKPVK